MVKKRAVECACRGGGSAKPPPPPFGDSDGDSDICLLPLPRTPLCPYSARHTLVCHFAHQRGPRRYQEDERKEDYWSASSAIPISVSPSF